MADLCITIWVGAQSVEVHSQNNSPWKDKVFLAFILGQLLALGVFDQMYGTFGIFLREYTQAGAEWIAYLFTMNALLVVLFQIPVTRLIERYGVVVVTRLGAVLLSCAFLFLNMGNHVGWPVLTMLLITCAELLLTPAWVLAVMSRSENRQRGKYLGIFGAAWLGHSLYGPGVGALIYGTYGGHALWWICALAGCLVFVLHYTTVARLSCRQSSSV